MTNPSAESKERDESQLIHDWNAEDPAGFGQIQLVDETLRDGLQSPGAWIRTSTRSWSSWA